MCQIQFIKRLGSSLKGRDINEFFKLMEFGSLNNNDAFGFFNQNHLFKEEGIFNLKHFKEKKLLSDGFIVGHNRFTTTGDGKFNKNNHPFKLDDFVLVHNGMIFNDEEIRNDFKIKSKIETDSFSILYLINHFFNKSKKKNRIKKMVEAIQKTTLNLYGNFSVFVYDKKTQNLYYFKNSKTSFKFCLLDDNVLIGSTNEENLKHVYLNNKYIFDEDVFKKRIYKTAEDNTIYLINEDVVIKEIGMFTELEEEEILNENKVYNEYYNKTKKDDLSFDINNNLIDEVDYCLNNVFGFSPEFEVLSDEIVKLKGFGIIENIPLSMDYNKDGNDFIYIKVDDVLNYGYGIINH